jgi:hypothetical protein
VKRALLAVAVAACGGDSTPADDAACDPAACAANGQLCEGDACVDPWRYGSPVFSTCPDEPRATAESLADKAAAYDARLVGLHIAEPHPWVLDVITAPGTDPLTATAADVIVWRSGENDGLWTGLALASQAYRYAATHDAAALSAIRTLLAGERTRMAITGVPGLFTRQLIMPGAAGLECPTDPAVYVPSPEKRGNKWIRIGADGCAQTADPTTLEFVSSAHCGLDAFVDWCWLDNISQDEYVGHMFGLAAVARLVDDPAARGDAIDMLDQIGTHLLAHDMEFTDWDGRPTQWGKIHPGAFGDTPGYLAVMATSFLADIAVATGDPVFADAERTIGEANLGYLDEIDLWSGGDACLSNWNNISMLAANFHHALWNLRDPARRDALELHFSADLMEQGAKAALAQHNPWFDIMWAAMKPLGPDDPPAYAAVEDAVCQLRQFPASNHGVAHPENLDAPHACDGRQGESLAADPFEAAVRCAATYAWWGNPYRRDACTDDATLIWNPTGFLLPYWMGRYYRFITPAQ